MNYPTARPFQRDKHGYNEIHLVSSSKDNGNQPSVTFQGTIDMVNALEENILYFLATPRSDNGINT